MNINIKTILAKEIVSLANNKKDDILQYGQFINGELEIESYPTVFKQIKEIMDSGISATTVVNIDNYGSSTLLLNQILKSDTDIKIVELITSYLNAKDLEMLPEKEKTNLFKLFSDDYLKGMEKMFECGYILKQGNKEDSLEVDIVLENNLKALEIIANYQPNFDYLKKYTNIQGEVLTLKEYAIEESNPKNEALIAFLGSCEKHQLFKKMDKDLVEKEIGSPKAKI